MIRQLIVVALVLTACGSPATLAGATPLSTTALTAPPTSTPSAAASASAAPKHLPGSSVRLTVNGAEEPSGVPLYLADNAPSTVVVAFPVDMDRASVERWLPRNAVAAWRDDRTFSFTVAATDPNPSFKIPEATSKDGSTIIDIVVVNLTHRPSAVLSVFTVSEILGGAKTPKDGAPRIPAGRGTGTVASPDGSKVLVAGMPDLQFGPSPWVFDLATRAETMLTLPASREPLSVTGWAGNDRIVLLGDRVWLAPIDGNTPRALADLAGLGPLKAAEVSPDGRFVAVASMDHLAVVDLASGTTRALAGHRDDCQAPFGPLPGRLAWSKDGGRLAVLECAVTAPTVSRTRIVDVAADRTVAIIDGGDHAGIGTLLTGEFALSRAPDRTGEGAPTLWLIFSFDGVERTRFLLRGSALSPDGRYVIEPGCCAGGPTFALIDLTDPARDQRATFGAAQWLRDGRLLVVTP